MAKNDGMAQTEPAQRIVEIENGTKIYVDVPVIEHVDFALLKGEIHGLVGENGAGKSTLTKVMAGVTRLTRGELRVDGIKARFDSPAQALRAGIAMVFQEPGLVETMTVAQNLYLGQEKFVNRLRGIYIHAQQLMQSLNFNVDPTAYVGSLGAAQKQMVEIARAVLHNAKVIIFDEPTATLTPEEKEHFFNLTRDLKQHGVSIIFISHALEEALELTDRITVMRDGKIVATDRTSNFDRDKLVKLMVGRPLTDNIMRKRRKPRKAGERILSVQNVRKGEIVRNTSLSIFEGQITGVFGLVGSGRTETFKIVAGVMKRDFLYGGMVYFNNQPIRFRTPGPAVADGIVYVTEDRKVEGFFETMNSARNIYTGHLAKGGWRKQLLNKSDERTLGREWIEKLEIAGARKEITVVELSGGNQQKVVIAKSVVQSPKLIIFDEPTRGVDVGAIEEIHTIINKLADSGIAVVVISSYLPEILALSDRILISKQGRIVEELAIDEATEEKIMYAAVH